MKNSATKVYGRHERYIKIIVCEKLCSRGGVWQLRNYVKVIKLLKSTNVQYSVMQLGLIVPKFKRGGELTF